MRDLSLFLIKNSLGGKMKKGLRNFCNDDGSTSTLNQQHHHNKTMTSGPPAAAADTITTTSSSNINAALPAVHRSPTNNYSLDDDDVKRPPPTLEEMILRLDLEEELIAAARSAKLQNNHNYKAARMSCVNNSDILRSARNALNQYPRFSLDGKDAMYRSSFTITNTLSPAVSTNLRAAHGGRKSASCTNGNKNDYDYVGGRHRRLRSSAAGSTRVGIGIGFPATLAGERVVWCKPGVVAKLMGLEAMPVPQNRKAPLTTCTEVSPPSILNRLPAQQPGE